MEHSIFRSYSEHLKSKYGEKVYKLPINLPVSCPNRQNGQRGCIFCAESGTGFESCASSVSVTEQMERTRKIIEKKYKAHKFIAYFQNYTNTFLPEEDFEKYVIEAASVDDVVEIAVSTRPDCIRQSYLEILKQVAEKYGVQICVELGLQTVNYHVLDSIHRGHGLAEFLDAVNQVKAYDFEICTHIILNLPGDTMRDALETAKILSAMHIHYVKLHSLYIAKNTLLCDAYENGTISLCSKEEYFHRLQLFLEHLDPSIVVERLFSRIPEKDSVFCNWNSSWWKLQEEFLQMMSEKNSYQGKAFDYLNGAGLKYLK